VATPGKLSRKFPIHIKHLPGVIREGIFFSRKLHKSIHRPEFKNYYEQGMPGFHSSLINIVQLGENEFLCNSQILAGTLEKSGIIPAGLEG
jgi:hypothetical protein